MFSKICFSFLVSHWVYLPEIMFLSPKLRLLALLKAYTHQNPTLHTKRFVSMAIIMSFGFRALFENKRAPKRGRNATFQKWLKFLHDGVIKTLFAKHDAYKFIGMTFSTYRSITNVEPPSKNGHLVHLKIWFSSHFFTVYILNNVFCKFQFIPAENDFGISNFPSCCPKYNFWDKAI